MKLLTTLSLLTLGLMTASSAYAVHHLVFLSAIIKLSNTECAVEMEVFGDNQDAFVPEDNLDLNGTLLVGFQAVIDAGINDGGGENDDGDTVLAASPSFESTTGLDADLSFADSNCANFTSTSLFTFFIDTDSEIDAVDASTVSGFGSDNTSITKANEAATPSFVNLASSTLSVVNNAGESATVGTAASSGGSSSGGCSLIK